MLKYYIAEYIHSRLFKRKFIASDIRNERYNWSPANVYCINTRL